MRSTALRLAGLLLVAVLLSACDKCGEPVKFNAPWKTKTCHDQSVK